MDPDALLLRIFYPDCILCISHWTVPPQSQQQYSNYTSSIWNHHFAYQRFACLVVRSWKMDASPEKERSKDVGLPYFEFRYWNHGLVGGLVCKEREFIIQQGLELHPVGPNCPEH